MIKKIILIVVFLSFVGCRDYNSEQYINYENEAIYDLIPELTNFEKTVEMYDRQNEDLQLFLFSTLDTTISQIDEPEGYTIAIDDVRLPEEEIIEGKRIYDKEYKNYEEEQKLFAPLKNGTIKKRTLNYKFKYSNLEVKLLSQDKIHDFELKENELGYLSISRIIFNRSFTKGYLSFSFFCGINCAWDNNVEIIKVKGKWKVSRAFSGGIA